MNELGNYLKELRGTKSLREVARECGISHTYLDTLEKGYDPRTKKERKPTPEVLKKLANYYNIDYKYLMYLADYIPYEMYKQQKELKQRLTEKQQIITIHNEDINRLKYELMAYQEKTLQLANSYDDKERLEIESELARTKEKIINLEQVLNKAKYESHSLEKSYESLLNKIDELGTIKSEEEKKNIQKEIENYKTSLIEAFSNPTENVKKEITVPLPLYEKEIKEGLTAIGKLSDDELRRRLFNLYDLLDLRVDLYYKEKLLTDEDREKIQTMLEMILK